MQRHKDWLYRYIRRYIFNAEDAEDILQESFVSAWGALARYDPERPFSTWIRRIALNKCRDKARRDKVYRAVVGGLGLSEGALEAPSDERAPDSSTIAAATLARVHQSIRDLPAPLRDPLILTALEGLSYKEAAAVLGLTPKAVELKIARARARLAETLAREDIIDLED
jgi:RNA polymerase sigma factor (sigma-70 family)